MKRSLTMQTNLASIYDFDEVEEQASLQKRDARLNRALIYREELYPILERLLDPQNTQSFAKQLQKELDESVEEAINNEADLYASKAKKARVLSKFIDEVFNEPKDFGLNFNSPPSVNDKLWAKTLLIHDLIYYGPITILILERILRLTENLEENPIYHLMTEISFGGEITEIRANNHEDVYFDRGNNIFTWNIPFISEKQFLTIIERMISESNLLNGSAISLNTSSPIADFEHPCGYIRGAAVANPASEAPFLTLRVHPESPYTLEQLMNFGMLDRQMADFLIACQKAGTTMVLAGTMGSGKTTILSALSEYWPDIGRKATIEDTPELRPRIKDIVKMRTIDYERNDLHNIDVARLTKACKRHSVRFVVLSEARDASAWEILQLSQAILGTLMTFHYTPRGNTFLIDQSLNTLAALCKQHPLAPEGDDIKHQIASMVQILLLIEQDPVDHVRRVSKIYYITGFDEMNGGHFKGTELFCFSKDPADYGYKRVNSCPEFDEYLQEKGIDYESRK